MQMLATLWSVYPGKTAACIAAEAGCAAMMAALIGLLMWPEAPDKMEDTP